MRRSYIAQTLSMLNLHLKIFCGTYVVGFYLKQNHSFGKNQN